jgi:hypothetical protein
MTQDGGDPNPDLQSRVGRLARFSGLLLVPLLVSCGPSEAAGPPDALEPDEEQRAVELGAPAADALMQGLVSELRQAMDRDGIAAAVAFCADDALDLTDQIQGDHDPGLPLKRTTLRWRNALNAPDPWEERMLQYLDRLERTHPDSVPTQLTGRGPDGTLRYYRVLRTATMCLHCHGPIPAMAQDVRQTIRERYPDDRATGYAEGDLRGVIRVQIPPEVENP